MIGSDADGFDHADAKLTADDGCWNQPAAGDHHHGTPVLFLRGQTPGKGARVAVELIPGHGEGFFGQGHGRTPGGNWNAFRLSAISLKVETGFARDDALFQGF